jgi:hypothetical protein
MQIRTLYALGQTVFHRLARERAPGLITGLQVYPGGYLYQVTWPDRSESRHYELELTTEYVPDFGTGG